MTKLTTESGTPGKAGGVRLVPGGIPDIAATRQPQHRATTEIRAEITALLAEIDSLRQEFGFGRPQRVQLTVIEGSRKGKPRGRRGPAGGLTRIR